VDIFGNDEQYFTVTITTLYSIILYCIFGAVFFVVNFIPFLKKYRHQEKKAINIQKMRQVIAKSDPKVIWFNLHVLGTSSSGFQHFCSIVLALLDFIQNWKCSWNQNRSSECPIFIRAHQRCFHFPHDHSRNLGLLRASDTSSACDLQTRTQTTSWIYVTIVHSRCLCTSSRAHFLNYASIYRWSNHFTMSNVHNMGLHRFCYYYRCQRPFGIQISIN
jgi:hypothetical protein